MNRWGIRLTLFVTLLVLGGCGRGTTGPDSAAPSDERPNATTATERGRGSSFRLWYEASFAGSTSMVKVNFDAPAGTGCNEKHEPLVESGPDVVAVSVRFYEPFVPTTCSLTPQSIVVDLGAPLGSRMLKVYTTDVVFRDVGGRLEIVPESTQCGRADCSTPSPAPAPCTQPAYEEAIRGEIDGGIGSLDEHCDGSFLILTLEYDSACLPEQRRDAACARFKKAYFVANAGNWRIVTYGDDETCDSVWSRTHIRFPAGLCAESAAATSG